MKKFLVLTIVAAFLFSLGGMMAGCEKKEPEPKPTENQPPPEPSPEEISNKIITEALGSAVMGAVASGKVSPEVRAKLVEDLTKARSANQTSENGQKALNIVSGKLEEIVMKAKTERQWDVVLLGIAGYEVFNKDSATMKRIKEQADLESKKPIVVLKAFMTDQKSNRVFAILQIQNQMTGEVKTVNISEGEEAEGLRFNKVIGDNRGIELEYMAIPGDMFEVMMAK